MRAADRRSTGQDDAEHRADDEQVEEVPAGGAGADASSAETVEVDPDDEASPPEPSPLNDIPGVDPRQD
ncbi:hypothetical protein GCM10011490_12410 [Pseudoclavibacter endophyticus]|uniref:Uncharacterized protein n=1 Tax=Pseudoclavibacter endophyticus TaxID=1778590 RepID=A0A6H9WSM3_9MICO|nr:hypothetical protein [Pseudoclavibacter endophyticus]KAB1649344.1 hypothetical protein F8O04_03485 [Pseudoclavibacter endophyticus]GGA63320.1 hypothetical protein GCM10011490_12410 [Pseudoclavibacter endophyticus]